MHPGVVWRAVGPPCLVVRAVAVVRFQLYAGARKSVALRLKWGYIHGDGAVLPDSKAGPRIIWLGSPARAIGAARQLLLGVRVALRQACDSGQGMEWNAIREAAGLGTPRIPDLWHSHATVAVNRGEGLRVVAGLLGHACIATTFGYVLIGAQIGR